MSGERIDVRSDIGFIYSDQHGLISTNGEHAAINVNEIIYDNLNPQGISHSDWKIDLGIDAFPGIEELETKPF